MVRVFLGSGIVALGLISASANAQLGATTGVDAGVGVSANVPAVGTSVATDARTDAGVATTAQDGNSTLKSAVRKSRRDAPQVAAGASTNSRAEVKTSRPSSGS